MREELFWVVACTKAQRERWAAENVARQGFEYYLPVTEVSVPRAKQKLQCLFPRYLFVRTDGRWRFLAGTYGVTSVVMQGQYPAVMPDKTIAQLKAREDSTGRILLPKLPDPFKKGDRVRINEGAFSGYNGIYQATDSSHRVKVLLEYLGRQTPVLIGEEALEAAE
jgi:transcriptional antiterminator RfaH